MRSSRNRIALSTAGGVVLAAALTVAHVRADIEPWMQTAVSGSAIEAALYRAMDLPGLRTLYPRPPIEARGEVDKLVAGSPADAQLYALRAHVEEQALDFAAAEKDWKAAADHAQDKVAAEFALADFYHRRNQGEQEISALEAAAALPSPASETYTPADSQAAWQAFPRALKVVDEQALGDDAAIAIYRAWIARYPAEPAVRGEFIAALLKMRPFDDVQRAIDDYKTAFPQDRVFPIKAQALLAFRKGTPDATAQALAGFERSYQPLWPTDLISTYFELLDATHTRHAMLIATRAELVRNPDGLGAASKLFQSYQQQGRMDAALNVLAEYGASKSTRHVQWSADELYTCATLLARAAQYPAAARYYYAFAAASGNLSGPRQSAAEAGLVGLTRTLLNAPDQPVALGAGNLSMYRDLAMLDYGPGYLNGILSLWLNSEDPASEFHDEEQKATRYFHRQKAAELLTQLDQRFPASAERPELHADLIEAYVTYGQDAAVKQAGERFLSDFPNAPQRLGVALDVADADARTNDTQAEFALYDRLLSELSTPLHGMALTAAGPAKPVAVPAPAQPDENEDVEPAKPTVPAAGELLEQSLKLPVAEPPNAAVAREYSQVLDRYIGRLVATGQPLAALALLRRELDRNPNDPLFYERLAAFLEQNDLSAQEEEVYRKALERFNDTSFYDKLARFYIRHQRRQDFDALTRKVVEVFQGTELAQYFANVNRAWPQQYLQLNLYAHQRFPHDLVFIRNLLSAYQARDTRDPAAYERLLREHWQEAPDLQSSFFHLLSSSGRLNDELAALQKLVPSEREQQQDPAAVREIAEIHLWQSHFEQSAPLLSQLATAYPADTAIGGEAASVFRSLAYFDPAQIARSVQTQQQLAQADPANLERLAGIGDTYADSTASSLNLDAARQLADAAPFWHRMAEVHPGVADGYLQSATVFWGYFDYDAALGQIQAARAHFHDPAMFGYHAGAIYEGKRDYTRAVAEYVAAAAADGSDSSAQSRLVELAQRPALAITIDQATANSVAAHPTVAALELRADVLNALHRQADLQPVLDSAITRAATVDEVSALAAFSQTHQLPAAYRSALQREVSLTTDPIQRMQLQYELARAWQDAGNVPEAQRVIEVVYSDGSNSRILGVVRATTDFYWNTKQRARAITTLVRASQTANAGLSHQFQLEAIAKSNQSGDFTGARTLLKPLLTAEPFNPQYLNLQAESYSLAHDSAGLRDFHMATLAALRAAQLPALEKRDKIALVRQGLIPALTDLKDYAGVIDQHTALISAFPEDASILQAAASYARRYAMEPRLLAFLKKAVADSPRDSRFAIDLGRVDVQFEDYAGALDAYSKAIAIRSDRPDLYIARADLEEHQQAFDAVYSDYDRLYLLTYKDPQWMEKAALARARQGRPELAVKALETAWLEGRTPAAPDYFRVASQLEKWDMLQQADTFVAQGVKLARDDLLADPSNLQGVVLYARLLARERKAADGFSIFDQALQSAVRSPSSPGIVVKQIETQGLASVTDSDWRKHLVDLRQQQARQAYNQAALEMSAVAAEYYTPEEKVGFAALLDAKHSSASLQEIVGVWIPAAAAAGLKDREAALRRDVLLSGDKLAGTQLRPYNELENARMDYATLGDTLDAYARQLAPGRRPGVIYMAATAWRNAGNRQRELADLRTLVVNDRDVQFQERLFQMYLHRNPEALLQLTSMKAPLADAAANYLFAHGTQAQTYRAVANRTALRPAVWNSATRALVGLYFGDTSPATDSAFQGALANDPIGERLQARPDEAKQIVGPTWFYYGERYGYFLTLAPTPAHDPEDYLPSQLELSSSDPASHYSLANTYLDAHKVDDAIAEYRHVIELQPADPLADISIAEALWSAGRHNDALNNWNEGLRKLRAMVDVRAVPENFWTSFAKVADDANSNHIGAQLRPGMDTVLTAYVRKNGNYRSEELLSSAYRALSSANQSDAVNWVLSVVAAIPKPDQSQALSTLIEARWFPRTDADPVYRRMIVLAQQDVQGAKSDAEANYPESRLQSIQTQYIQWLLANQRTADAQRTFDSIPANQRQTDALQVIAVLLAAKQSRVPALLAAYANDLATAPSLSALAQGANRLRAGKDNQNARLVLEYVFDQKLRAQLLSAPDYLGLAEARINTGDILGAMDLLTRLMLQGNLYENLDSAASLLVRTGHTAEALPLLKKLAAGVPWNTEYHLRLGEAQLALKQASDAANTLSSIAQSDQAPYATRASAATRLHGAGNPPQMKSAELSLLASGSANPQEVDQAYFVYARILASTSQPVQQRAAILRAAIELAPASMLEWLRLCIFQAEAAQNHYELAQVAIAPVLASHGGPMFFAAQPRPADSAPYYRPSADDAGRDPMPFSAAAPAESADDDKYSVRAALPSDEDKRTFLMTLASIDEHLDNLGQAIANLRAADRLSATAAWKTAIESRIKALEHRLDVAQQNATRRPTIQKSIEQTVRVRPRIVLASASSSESVPSRRTQP